MKTLFKLSATILVLVSGFGCEKAKTTHSESGGGDYCPDISSTKFYVSSRDTLHKGVLYENESPYMGRNHFAYEINRAGKLTYWADFYYHGNGSALGIDLPELNKTLRGSVTAELSTFYSDSYKTVGQVRVDHKVRIKTLSVANDQSVLEVYLKRHKIKAIVTVETGDKKFITIKHATVTGKIFGVDFTLEFDRENLRPVELNDVKDQPTPEGDPLPLNDVVHCM